MAKTITIQGNGAMDEAQRAEALQYINNKATTEQLLKLKKLAGNAQMIAMLNNF